MREFVLLKYTQLARGRAIGVFLDLHVEPPLNCQVLQSYKDQIYDASPFIERSVALDLAEELELCCAGPEGSSDWKDAWARITEKEEPRAKWEGSAAELATRFYAIGTWNWIVTLTECRRLPA
jgi:hypothetical protein